MTRRNFIREKKIKCGNDYLEVDIIPITEQEKKIRGKKAKKSPKKLINQNDKRARRYFIQKTNSNFGWGDYHVTTTYNKLPETLEEAEKTVTKYLDRLRYHMRKKGIELKYILITEFGTKKDTGRLIRLHHHIIINGGLDRDTVENLWCERRKKGDKKIRLLGFVNADRLQPNEFGLEAVCRYLTKNPNGKKRWSCSQNLKEPDVETNDSKYSFKKVRELVKTQDREFFEKEYPGYILTQCKAEYTDERGWAIYLKMRRLRI